MELNAAAIVRVPTAINAHTVGPLHLALESAFQDSGSRVVVLQGGEMVFCLGLELDGAADLEHLREALERFADCLEMIRTGRKPVLALVQGRTIGGGVGLAAACDGVLAVSGATFTLPELALGLTPAVILPYLAQRVRLQALRWKALMADVIHAEEALDLGLVEAVCAPEAAEAIIRSWIRKLGRIDLDVITAWKRMTINAPAPGTKDGVDTTFERLSDPRVRDGLRTFLETGEPPWLERR